MPINERKFDNMYWTPAPAKWDVAPAHVKAVLFPHYHGSEQNGSVPANEDRQAVDSSDGDEEDVSVTTPQLHEYLNFFS